MPRSSPGGGGGGGAQLESTDAFTLDVNSRRRINDGGGPKIMYNCCFTVTWPILNLQTSVSTIDSLIFIVLT